MKSLAVTCFLLLLLLFWLNAPVHASFTVQSVINQNIDVSLDFANFNSSVWQKIQSNSYLFNDTTFPNIIVDNFKRQYSLNETFYLPDSTIELNNATRSMTANFSLYGSDIVSFTFNYTAMANTCSVRTEWRNFYANFTNDQGVHVVSLNFTEYFGTPLSSWEEINYTLNGEVHPAYFYNYTGQADFDPLFYFVLPTNANNVRVVGETIVFELPPALWVSLLNSPFPIVGALIIITIAAFLYRKLGRR
jgi:hypothetical protein